MAYQVLRANNTPVFNATIPPGEKVRMDYAGSTLPTSVEWVLYTGGYYQSGSPAGTWNSGATDTTTPFEFTIPSTAPAGLAEFRPKVWAAGSWQIVPARFTIGTGGTPPPVAALNTLSLNPASVQGGNSSTGTVTLTSAAPTGGFGVTLSDNSASSATPASVTVLAGATSANFTITTSVVGSTTPVTVTAVAGSVTRTATLTLTAGAPPTPTLTAVSVNPSSVVGGSPSTGTVTLTSAALSGGFVVNLSENNAATSVPATVTVPQGSTTANFTVSTIGVGSTQSVTVTAIAGVNTRTANLSVTAVVGGGGVDRTITGTIAGFTVPAGQTWRVQGLVNCSQNVIVNGTLRMRAGDDLHFTGINEANVRGGGDVPIASDVGVWVLGAGKLDFVGTTVEPWGRATGGIAAGATQVTLDRDPIGWQVGHALHVLASLPATDPHCVDGYDWPSIKAISGRTITFNSPLRYAHPAPVIDGVTRATEVVNLSRDCIVRGDPNQRSHIFMKSSVPQIIQYVKLTNMGPQRMGGHGDPTKVQKILGRWPIHFHHQPEGMRGTNVLGVLSLSNGSHSFVQHNANGITFTKCTAINVQYTPFWWDRIGEGEATSGEEVVFDVVWDRCLASVVWPGLAAGSNGDGGFRLSGFGIARGEGNSNALGCVAASVAGHTQTSGFDWPENNISQAWDVEDCVAHNNSQYGAVWWQNAFSVPKDVKRFIAYYNKKSGAFMGAYVDPLKLTDCKFYGNGPGQEGQLLYNLQSSYGRNTNIVPANQAYTFDGVPANERVRFLRCTFDGAGVADGIFINHDLRAPAAGVSLIEQCTFKNIAAGKVCVRDRALSALTTIPNPIRFLNCTWNGQRFRLSSPNGYRHFFQVSDAAQSPITIQRADRPGGTLNTTWNAKVYPGFLTTGT